MIFKNRTILPLNTVNISCLERCNKKVFQNFLTSHCFVISKLLEKFFTKNSCYNLLFYCLTIYTLWLNIFIIKSHRTSRRIRPPRCLTNTFCVAQPLWLLPSSSSQLCFTLSRHGPHIPATDDRLSLGGYYGAHWPLGRWAITWILYLNPLKSLTNKELPTF